MYRTAIIRGLVTVVLSAALLWAGDPWKDKPYKEWTRGEAEKVLQESPWAHTVRAFGRPQSLRPVPDLPEAKSLTVLWWSSVTVRQAIVRQQELRGARDQQQAGRFLSRQPEDYVIAVYRPDVIRLYTQGSLRQLAMLEEFTEEELNKSAYLKMKTGKKQVSPVRVRYIREGPNLMQVEVYFPRQLEGAPVIGVDETEVEFGYQSSIGRISSSFNLRKMVRDGKPDL